jgi:hypothetical protein
MWQQMSLYYKELASCIYRPLLGELQLNYIESLLIPQAAFTTCFESMFTVRSEIQGQ